MAGLGIHFRVLLFYHQPFPFSTHLVDCVPKITMTSNSLIGLLTVACLALSCLALRPELSQNVIVSTSNETPCDACTQLIVLAKAYVSNPTTQQRIMTFVLQDICPKLPEADRQYCTIYAPLAVAAASGWIQSRQPSDICGQAGLCAARVCLNPQYTASPIKVIVAIILRSHL